MNYSGTIRGTQMEPACTRQQARELLEALRAEYQGLPASERWLLGNVLEAVVRGTGQAAMTERRQHSRSEFGVATIENVAYAVLRKANVAREMSA